MQHAAYMRLYPAYLAGSGMSLLAAQHRSAIYLYFQSMRGAPLWKPSVKTLWDKSYINAQSTNAQVTQMMNLQRIQIVDSISHMSENNFAYTQDDKFNLQGDQPHIVNK